MKRSFSLLVFCLSSISSQCLAASWTDGLFSELRHEFGNIPRGSDQRCTFVLKNTTDGPVRIVGMQRTCGCTQITLDDKVVLDHETKVARETKQIQPGQEARIGVMLDTRNFLGSKSAEITVSFDKPSAADVRLTVNSYIRQDIVLNPGAIQFGSVSRGQDSTKVLDIEYAGQQNWKIMSVTNTNQNLEVNCNEMYRRPGQVGYKLMVSLKPNAPTGFIRDAIMIETNDLAAPHFPVIVSGQIQADLIVTPTNLTLGTVKPGQSVTRQVLLRGKQPFQITQVDGGDAMFQIEKPQGSNSFHRVVVKFSGSEEPGTRECTFRIRTDLADESAAEFKATVQVLR